MNQKRLPLRVINVAKEFSQFPAGRVRSDGPHSGQRFREDILVPALQAAEKLTIDLDGAEGFGSSFLEESFGGLIRTGILNGSEFSARVTFISDVDTSLIEEINEYIRKADAARQGS